MYQDPIKIRNRRIIITIGSLWLVVIIVLIVVSLHHKKNVPANPPSAAIQTVTKYLQAREDNVGADQTSPDSWLANVKPLTTAAWFAQLQPLSDPETSSESNDYRVAHQNNYIIKATVSNCAWQNKGSVQATADSGVIICKLTDSTVDRATGNQVPANDLLYGWVHNGPQQAPVLEMVKQNGTWLINSDATGEGQ